MNTVRLLAATLLVVGLDQANSQAATLGDPAAPLRIAEWIKGKPISLDEAKGKQILVVEFWATWCGPCRVSIPHLTELQKKYRDRDVVIIGVSDEKASVVKPFVEKYGDKMDYTVVADDQRQTSAGYMEAYGQGGIPHAFIVDKQGRVVWHGHPLSELESTLEDVIAGKLDLERVQQRSQAQDKVREYVQMVMRGDDATKTAQLAAELKALDKELGGIQPGRPFDPDQIRRQVRFSQALRDYQRSLASDADADALSSLERTLRDTAPAGFDLEQFKRQVAANKLVQDYLAEATSDADETRMAELGRRLASIETDSAQMLNEIAWRILTDSQVKRRDLPLALKLAKAAYDACQGQNAAVVDTYARALFDTGEVAKAIEFQRKAVSLSEDEEIRRGLEETLQRYEAQRNNRPNRSPVLD